MSAEGRLVRGTPTGAWTSRQHRWEPVSRWWPNGLPGVDPDQAREALARRWLTCFGPATVDDLQWWTGWNKTTVRRTLGNLQVDEIDLHGGPGIVLGAGRMSTADAAPCDAPLARMNRADVSSAETPCASLLPALDPSPMGWKQRDWMFGIDQRAVFDQAGNIGPTVWWNGEVIGSWATTAAGELRTRILADRGAQAVAAVDSAAAQLHKRLDGATVTPAIRTSLERSISHTTRPKPQQ
jgi:hypothetical protein